MKEILSVTEAAEIIGICSHTLYTMIREKQFPAAKFRRRILIRHTAMMKWMELQESKQQGA